MRSGPNIESDNRQIHEVEVHIPFRKILGLIAITLIFQATGTLAAAYYVGKTHAAQLLDMGTMLAIAVAVMMALLLPGAVGTLTCFCSAALRVLVTLLDEFFETLDANTSDIVKTDYSFDIIR